jgi:VIT1/CCC1 family predicted Fe2+/Mn2+ transporter
LAFAAGAAVPLALVGVLPEAQTSTVTFVVSLMVLMALGAVGARLGGARILPAAIRVGFWGVVAMSLTALIGRVAGVSIT